MCELHGVGKWATGGESRRAKFCSGAGKVIQFFFHITFGLGLDGENSVRQEKSLSESSWSLSAALRVWTCPEVL